MKTEEGARVVDSGTWGCAVGTGRDAGCPSEAEIIEYAT